MDSAPPPPPKDVPSSSGSASVPTIVHTDVEGSTSTDLSSLTPLELQQLNQNIMNESASRAPLISESMPIGKLREEYESGASSTFVMQIDYLKGQGYSHIRRTRGDGDCFYRSLAFAWIGRMLKSRNQTIDVAKSLSLLDSTLLILKAAGFQDLVYEDFYDVLISLIRQIVVPEPNGSTLTEAILLEAFQDAEVSNCIVVFLRLLTSAAIRTDPDTYAPFLFHPESGLEVLPQEYCERFVEAIQVEADHVQITALTKILKLNIEVAYLDGHNEDGSVNFVQFHNVPPEDFENPPVLLYRPGHYDILEQDTQF
ncbi:cysteine ase [Pyrrhoderma noxium]|uniref:ubiquitinyl hydrolase 1 n=1 Tax=Pyrrhoderma noxium TaxID=2282107 RepID=A0A286U7V6_9AGAM|nr:cysteine ase [Pyrrhoderma noxium]